MLSLEADEENLCVVGAQAAGEEQRQAVHALELGHSARRTPSELGVLTGPAAQRKQRTAWGTLARRESPPPG